MAYSGESTAHWRTYRTSVRMEYQIRGREREEREERRSLGAQLRRRQGEQLYAGKITLATLWRVGWREANWRQRSPSEGVWVSR